MKLSFLKTCLPFTHDYEWGPNYKVIEDRYDIPVGGYLPYGILITGRFMDQYRYKKYQVEVIKTKGICKKCGKKFIKDLAIKRI